MTLEELVALARTRGWRFVAPGHRDRGWDGVHVLGRDGAGWYVGFLERGATVVLHRATEEDAAVAALHGALVRASETSSGQAADASSGWPLGSDRPVLTERDLVAFVEVRGWKLVTPAHDPGSDDVHVLGLQDGRWRVGYRERGVVDWDPGTLTEREAVDVVLRRLRRGHTFELP